MARTIDFKVTGEQTIHCASCEQRISKALHRMGGIQNVNSSAQTQQVAVTIDPAHVRPEQVQAKLEQLGYEVRPQGGSA